MDGAGAKAILRNCLEQSKNSENGKILLLLFGKEPKHLKRFIKYTQCFMAGGSILSIWLYFNF
jgi:hypothetical protein